MNRLARFIAAAAVALGAASCATLGGGTAVDDPHGRFSLVAGPELTPKLESDGLYRYRMEKEGIDVLVCAVDAGIEEQGVEKALAALGVDPSRLTMAGSTSFGDWQAARWHVTGGDLAVALAWQARGTTVYAVGAAAPLAAMPGDPPGPVMRLVGSIRFTPAAGSIAIPGTRADLEAAIDRASAARGGAISVAVVRNGAIVYRYASGMSGIEEHATSDSAFHWGSMTKIVTATAVLELAEKKLIDLDASASRWVPGLSRMPQITVRHLLTHSSGLPNREVTSLIALRSSRLPALAEVLATYLAGVDRLDFAPGSDSAYSNWNYLALGVLIERVTGMPYEAFVEKTILQPLGMARTSFRIRDLPAGTSTARPVIAAAEEQHLLDLLAARLPSMDAGSIIEGRAGDRTYLADFDILAPWGGLVGPADDAARFLAMHLGSAPPAAETVVSPATRAAMREVSRSPQGRTLGWSLGWVPRRVGGEEIVEHAGGGPGFETLMRIYPGRGLGVVVMGNVADYGAARLLGAAAAVFSR